jgi:hypothetical protein
MKTDKKIKTMLNHYKRLLVFRLLNGKAKDDFKNGIETGYQ